MKKTGDYFTLFFITILMGVLMVCKSQSESKPDLAQKEGKTKMDIQRQTFGKLPDGREIKLYTLTNVKGMEVQLMTYGATLVSLKVPDSNGNLEDITLGHYSPEGYLEASPYFGATVGRYANRIAYGEFTLNGVKYQLPTNEGEHHLHGGNKGFDKKLWSANPVYKENAVGVEFQYLSKDGEQGYPGNLSCTVTYFLTQDNQMKISYQAETDKPTPVNLTHHSYFNLDGQGEGDILDHMLMINAHKYTPVNENLIPTGEIHPVKGTPLDFTSPHRIGSRIDKVKGGYDHNYVLDRSEKKLVLAARVEGPDSGRIMEIYTTEPGIQFYSGNFLDGTITGKNGEVYSQYYGFCLEPQHFPDSPHHPNFPSTILKPGEKYHSLSVYKFYTQK